MESKFQIALVVLVVLAQLGGALVATWKKRQAERAKAEGRGNGGLVIVGQESSASSSPSSWGESGQSSRRTTASWDSAEDSDVDEAYEDEVKTWDEHVPGELNQAPPSHVHKPLTTMPEAAVFQQPVTFSRQEPGQRGERSERGEKGQLAMRRNVPSRASRLLQRSTLRQAVVAQLVLAPPAAARRLRP